MIYFQSLTQDDLQALLVPLVFVKRKRDMSEEEYEKRRQKKARYHSRHLFHWVYQRGVTEWEAMTDLPKDLRAWLQEHVEIYRLEVAQDQQSLDGTHKFL